MRGENKKSRANLIKKPVDSRVRHVPKMPGVFGVLAGEVYIYFGWSWNMQRRCGNLLSRGKFFMKVDFVSMPRVGKEELTEGQLRQWAYDLVERHGTLWPSGMNERNPLTGKLVKLKQKKVKA